MAAEIIAFLKKHTLLIIGNGFDLHCGLKSAFSDFMKEKVLISNHNGYYFHLSSLFQIKNIWYYLLAFRFYFSNSDSIFGSSKESELKWMSVEDFIKEVLVDDGKNALLLWLKELFKDVQENRCHSDSFFNKYEKNSEYTELIADYVVENHVKGKNLYDLLFEDLKSFENDFSSYLSEVLGKSDFINKAHKAFDSFKIIKSQGKLYIWSFNYTNPAFNYDCIFQRVHGELNSKENGIIIGIDQNEIRDANKNKYIYRFTKAWRKMANTSTTQSLPDKKEISRIAIYGHSLGPQDYSYFHSIFNYFDIANNKELTVVFYYSNYAFTKDNKPDVTRNRINYEKYVDSVFKLLLDYASNSISEKESKTFLTRLLLEERVKIELFNDDNDVTNDV